MVGVGLGVCVGGNGVLVGLGARVATGGNGVSVGVGGRGVSVGVGGWGVSVGSGVPVGQAVGVAVERRSVGVAVGCALAMTSKLDISRCPTTSICPTKTPKASPTTIGNAHVTKPLPREDMT